MVYAPTLANRFGLTHIQAFSEINQTIIISSKNSKMSKLRSFVAIIATSTLIMSCKPTVYLGSLGNVNQTQVILTKGNFKVLGSFSGTASSSKMLIGIKNKQGIVAEAKANLLENAKKGGAELTGSRTFINMTTDLVENSGRITATVSAEVIEFTKE
jgi:hypothetical protein